mgnify:CR=1 FL=1
MPPAAKVRPDTRSSTHAPPDTPNHATTHSSGSRVRASANGADTAVNGGGTLEREYAIGTRRMYVCLRYGAFTLGMELKVRRDGKPDPLTEGLAQLDEYLSGLGLETGWLVIFDQRSGLPDISERTTAETAVSPAGRTITVICG